VVHVRQISVMTASVSGGVQRRSRSESDGVVNNLCIE
jgi:hypothetical protein